MILMKIRTAIIITLFLYAALLSTHAGEFWPFSTYQMFSQGGKGWEKPVLVEMDESSCRAASFSHLSQLEPHTISLADYNIDHRDFSDYISFRKCWEQEDLQGLQRLIKPVLQRYESCIILISTELNEGVITSSFAPFLFMNTEQTSIIMRPEEF